MKFVFDVESLGVLDRAMARVPDLARQAVGGFMRAATGYLKGEVIERTPAAEGKLRGSIYNAVEEIPGGMLGVVATSLAYAVPVELGTKPHMAPIEPIEQWVRVKLGLSPKEARSAARRIQWKIAHYGTTAAGMFHRAFAASRGEVERQFALAMSRLRNLILSEAGK